MKRFFYPLFCSFLCMPHLGVSVKNADFVSPKKWRENIGKESTVGGERQLLNFLLRDYNKFIRPVRNSSQHIEVRFGMMTQKLDVFEEKDMLKAYVWPDMKWQDEFLHWDPRDYDGISDIRLPINIIWAPDIVLYNAADGPTHLTGFQEMRPHAATIYSDGTVHYVPQMVLKSLCSVQQSKPTTSLLSKVFGPKRVSCSMKFASWTYNGFKLDIQKTGSDSDGADLSNYMENRCWKLDGAKMVWTVVKYTCCPEPYPDITVHFNMTKKAC